MTLKIVHKRSNAIDAGEAKAPLPSDIEQGEIAINYSEEDPCLFIKDEADNVVRVVGGSSVAEDVIGGNGITVTPDANDEKVTISADLDTSQGLKIVNGKIATKTASNQGIDFSSGSIAAKVDSAQGIDFDAGAIAAKVGLGLKFDGNGQISARLGDGITIDSNGDITAEVADITGGNGITATKNGANNNVTIDADINTNKGLEFSSDKLAVRLGAGLVFNGSTGAIDSQAQALLYRGVVDMTANGNVPGSPTPGDTYANTVEGTISSDWQTATLEAVGTTVVPGDLVVWNGTKWTYIPTGGSTGGPDLWQLASNELSPIDDAYNVKIGGNNINLNADGSGTFAGSLGVGIDAPSGNLHVKGNQTRVRVDTSNSSSNVGYLFSLNGVTSGGVLYSNSSNALYFQTNGSTERMRLTSDGRLGVNIDSPGCTTGGIHAVHADDEGTPSFVGDEVGVFQRNFNSAQGSGIGIIGGSAGYSNINFGDKNKADVGKIKYAHDDNSMRFQTNGSEKIAIDASGNLKVGGTLPSAPNISLNANGDISGSSIFTTGKITSNSNGIQSGNNPSSGANTGTLMKPNGAFIGSASAADSVFKGYTTNNSSTTSSINADGSAAFAGNVQSGGTPFGAAADGIAFNAAGLLEASRSAAPNTIFRGFVTGNTSPNVEITAGGSATFAGNLGVGASGPAARLTIAGGTANNYTDGILLSKDGGNQYGIYPSTNNLEFRSVTGNAHIATFTYDGSAEFAGNVGIGTTSPSAPLAFGKSVYGDQTSEDFYRIKFTDFGGTANDVGIGQPDENSLAFNIQGGDTASFRWSAGTAGERMRLDGSGRLLVGTTTNVIWNQTSVDGVVIEQSGATQIVRGGDVPLLVTRNTNTGQIAKFSQAGTERGSIFYDGDFGIASASDLTFDIGGSEAMRLDSSGSAKFAGLIDVGSYSNTVPATTFGSRVSGGFVGICRNDNADVKAFEIIGSAGQSVVFNSNGSADFAGKVTSASTIDSDPDTTLVTKDYVDANTGGRVSRAGSVDETGTLLWGRNIASTAKLSRGKFEVIFSTALPNTEYIVNPTIMTEYSSTATMGPACSVYDKTTTGFKICTYSSGGLNNLNFEFSVFSNI